MLLDSGGVYYGEMNHHGVRHGEGATFLKTALDNPDFKAAWDSGATLKAEDFAKDARFEEYLAYFGHWRHGLAHGKGVQHMPEGTYDGDFRKGKRHGRGSWKSAVGVWEYKPVEDPTIANWQDDCMHGRGILETEQCIHENVIFKDGVCCMPWTEQGPPVTSFDDNPVVGPVMQTMRAGRQMITQGEKPSKPAESEIVKTAAGDDQPGAGALGDDRPAGIVQTRLQERETAAYALNAPEEVLLLREDTDTLAVELECYITGGTGDNAKLNGFYFKRADTFGIPLYEMRSSKGHESRWLYYLEDQRMWVLGNRQYELLPNPPLPAFAYYQQTKATSVEDLQGAWHVYHPRTRKYTRYKGPGDTMDHVTCRPVVGFAVSAKAPFTAFSGLYRRHVSEHELRPVYELEAGGMYLWSDGQHWVLSPNLGESIVPGRPPPSLGDHAYSADKDAHSPNQISAPWVAWDCHEKRWSDRAGFALRMQEQVPITDDTFVDFS